MNQHNRPEIYREAEEAGPELGLPVVEELGLGLEEGGEEISVAVLILAPVLEVLEDGVELVLRVLPKVPVDRDVPPVPDLLRQVRRIKYEFGLKEGVLPRLGEEPQVQCQVEVG